MKIMRLLQLGLVLAGSIATPGHAMMINGDDIYGWAGVVDEGYWTNEFLSAGADTGGVFTFGPESAHTPVMFMMSSIRAAVFESLGDIDQGAFDSGKLDGEKTPPGATEFDGGSYEVPEPGVLGLLGVGLVGIILGRRRRAVLAD